MLSATFSGVNLFSLIAPLNLSTLVKLITSACCIYATTI
nr:MAG TPA: hypothetical protein [Caudoviricetes sp.]